MKTILTTAAVLIALGLAYGQASAGVTCTTSGAYTYCNGGGGGHVTCTTSGSYTYCN
jgi:hypothetical protein